MHGVESRSVTGPANILFAGVYVCTLQPGNFTGWDSQGVKDAEYNHSRFIHLHFFQSSPFFSTALVSVTAVAHVGPQNKGHPARISHKWFKHVTLPTGTETCVFVHHNSQSGTLVICSGVFFICLLNTSLERCLEVYFASCKYVKYKYWHALIQPYFIHPITGNYSVNSHIKATTSKQAEMNHPSV